MMSCYSFEDRGKNRGTDISFEDRGTDRWTELISEYPDVQPDRGWGWRCAHTRSNRFVQ